MPQDKSTLTFVIIAGIGLIIAVGIGFIPAAYSIIAIPFAIIALLAAVIGFAIKDYYYLFEPIRSMKGRTIVLDNAEPFYLSPNSTAIIVRRGADIFATAFVHVPVYRSATEMSDDEKFDFAGLFSRIISLNKTPVRISSQLYAINKDEYIARINSKLNEVEERYNTMLGNKTAPQNELDRIKGEVTMWHNLMDNVSKANSQALSVYAAVSALGSTEDEAINLVSVKADEVISGISSTMGVTAALITGDDLLKFLEPEKMIPPATITELMKFKSSS